MKTETYIDNMLQKKIFYVAKKHNLAIKSFNLFIATVAGFCALDLWFAQSFNWGYFAAMCIICMIYCMNFFFSIDYLQLLIPTTDATLKLYKIGDEYFVGCSMHEAQLFANLQNKDDFVVEELENKVYMFK